jgi:putative copper resistance protein D
LVEGALVVARATHFAAILSLEGAVIFLFAIAAPNPYNVSRDDQGLNGLHRFLNYMMAVSLGVGVLSGATWLFILAGRIVGLSPANALIHGTDWTLLTETQFGEVWRLRAVASVLLALSLAVSFRVKPVPPSWAVISVILAVILTGSLAWAGHGAATPGLLGDAHLAADILHLVASGIWVGGLLPLAFVLRPAARNSSATCHALAAAVTRRFSSVAVASVLILIVTGIVNSYVLVGNVSNLLSTAYGQVLLVKVGLFALMLGFAVYNRLRLTPRLTVGSTHANRSSVLIARNSLIEFALGVLVLIIVGILGIMPPAHHKQRQSMDATTIAPVGAAILPVVSRKG